MAFVGAFIGSIALVSIVIVTIIAFAKANAISADYNNKFKTVVEQVNAAQYYEYQFDKKQKEKIDIMSKDTDSLRVFQEKSAEKLTGKALDIAGTLTANEGTAEANNIRFSKEWTGYPDNTTNRSEISNDTNRHKKLVIAGNRSGPTKERAVGIMDRLDVHGSSIASKWASGQNVHGRDHVVAGDWEAWMRKDGYIYAGEWVDGQTVRGRDVVQAGDGNAWMKKDGTAMFAGEVSIGSGTQMPEQLKKGGWAAGVQGKHNGSQTLLSHKSGHGIHVNTKNVDSTKYAIRLYNGSAATFQVNNDGKVMTGAGIYNSKADPGAMLERNYGSDANRYGIGQWPNGTTRVYAAALVAPATVNLGFAKANNGFDDVVKITQSNVNINKDVNLQGKTISAGAFKSINQGSNWMQVYRNSGDSLLFGSDDSKKGIASVGNRNFTVYTNGQPRLSIDSTGSRVKASASNLVVGASTDDNKTVSVFSSGNSGAEMNGNYQGGIMSSHGIGFKNLADGKTRFMHDTKTGDTTIGGRFCISDVCVNRDDVFRIKTKTLLPPVPNPVPCQVNEWKLWGACTNACGGGTQVRTRNITAQAQNGGTCPALTETQPCNTQACLQATALPVSCEVGSWNAWGSCTTSCGGGTQTRTRPVTVAAQNGGAPCPALSETLACNTQACLVPVNCQVSGWSGWSGCTSSCGGGTQTRSRSVTVAAQNGGTCPFLSETISCNTQACPKVSIYEHCNYTGWKISLAPGRYTMGHLQSLGFVNDAISSIYFTSPGQIILYEHDNFEGRAISFTNNNSCLVYNNFNDLTSSIVVV